MNAVGLHHAFCNGRANMAWLIPLMLITELSSRLTMPGLNNGPHLAAVSRGAPGTLRYLLPVRRTHRNLTSMTGAVDENHSAVARPTRDDAEALYLSSYSRLNILTIVEKVARRVMSSYTLRTCISFLGYN